MQSCNLKPGQVVFCTTVPRSRTVSARPCVGGTDSGLNSNCSNAKIPLYASYTLIANPSRRCWTAARTRCQASQTLETCETLRVTLNTKEVESSIKLTGISERTGLAIVVEDVESGSAAEQAGVRAGQRLLALSDPVRNSELLVLNDRPSVRFVRDAVRLRMSASINLVLSADVIQDWSGKREADLLAAEVGTDGDEGGAVSSGLGLEDSPLLGAVADGSGSESREPTIAEKLQADYARQQAAGDAQMSQYERRVKRRQEYMERESVRSDAGFFAIAIAVCALPALIILLLAWQSGYLESLAGNYNRY